MKYDSNRKEIKDRAERLEKERAANQYKREGEVDGIVSKAFDEKPSSSLHRL